MDGTDDADSRPMTFPLNTGIRRLRVICVICAICGCESLYLAFGRIKERWP